MSVPRANLGNRDTRRTSSTVLWLGPSLRDSYIASLEGDTVTIKVIQCTWNRRTQKYEEAVARDFHALGLQVVWKPFFSEKLRAEIEKAREEAMKAKMHFDDPGTVTLRTAAE